MGDTNVNLDAVGLPTASLGCPPKVFDAVSVPNAVQYSEFSTELDPGDKVVLDALTLNLEDADASQA